MRKVVSSQQVGHLWANQSQSEARNGSGSVYFNGPTFYSYSTPIARIYAGVAVLFTSRYYSVTTAEHASQAGGAIRGDLPYFRVPSIGALGGRNRETGQDGAPDHAANVAYLRAEYDAAVSKARRTPATSDNIDWNCSAILPAAQTLRDYCAAFSIAEGAIAEGEAFIDARDARAVFNMREEKYNAPGAAEKRAIEAEKRAARADAKAGRDAEAAKAQRAFWAFEQAQREARWAEERAHAEALAALTLPDRIAAWRAGQNPRFEYSERKSFGGALLRLKGDGETVQTSQGAEVPLDHARRLYSFALRCKVFATPYQRDGHAERVGAFAVESIDAAGNIVAGCHRIAWEEAHGFAIERGWPLSAHGEIMAQNQAVSA